MHSPVNCMVWMEGAYTIHVLVLTHPTQCLKLTKKNCTRQIKQSRKNLFKTVALGEREPELNSECIYAAVYL